MESVQEQMRRLREAQKAEASSGPAAEQQPEGAGQGHADAPSAPRSFVTAQSSGMRSSHSIDDAEDVPWEGDRAGEWYEDEQSYASHDDDGNANRHDTPIAPPKDLQHKTTTSVDGQTAHTQQPEGKPDTTKH